jgi:hypothetical protein
MLFTTTIICYYLLLSTIVTTTTTTTSTTTTVASDARYLDERYSESIQSFQIRPSSKDHIYPSSGT